MNYNILALTVLMAVSSMSYGSQGSPTQDHLSFDLTSTINCLAAVPTVCFGLKTLYHYGYYKILSAKLPTYEKERAQWSRDCAERHDFVVNCYQRPGVRENFLASLPNPPKKINPEEYCWQHKRALGATAVSGVVTALTWAINS